MKIHLGYLQGQNANQRSWHQVDEGEVTVFCNGFIFHPQTKSVLKDKSFAGHLIQAYQQGKELKLMGEYAFIIRTENRIYAQVDGIRSTPLFWVENDGFVISDDPYFLKKQLGDKAKINQTEKLAFLYQGMTIKDTFVDGIKEIPAGGALTFSLSEGVNLKIEPYGVIASRSDINDPKVWGNLVDEGVAVFESVFARYLSSVAHKPVAIPLSGGLDSRLIAAMLQRSGHPNLMTFTYGRRGSFESKTSRIIAGKLGLKWEFVPYTGKLWQNVAKSSDWQEYRRFCSRLTAIEHEQDWPAVQQLKLSGKINAEAIFIPGHSGDFLAGSHLPDKAFNEKNANPVDWIIRSYFRYLPLDCITENEWELIRGRLAEVVPDQVMSINEAVLHFDEFGRRSRQARMIANSVRVYENHGFDWRMPFWDAELLKFWPRVPIQARRDKKLYKAVLKKLLGNLMDIPYEAPAVHPLVSKINRLNDRDYRRYNLFLDGFKSIGKALVGHPESDRFKKYHRMPVQKFSINGWLALGTHF